MGNGNAAIMRSLARANGYTPIIGAGANQVALRNGHARMRNQGRYRSVTDRFGGRYVVWVTYAWEGIVLSHVATHFPIATDQTTARLNKISGDLIATTKNRAKYGPVTWAGDLNVDPDQRRYPTKLFRNNKMMTIWDDADMQVPTTRNTVDAVGRYAADSRIKFARYKAWPRQNSNHRPISGFYDIDVTKKSGTGGTTAPTPSPSPTPPTSADPDPLYATGGNVDWSDYTDAELYALPYAVDDSDTRNG